MRRDRGAHSVMLMALDGGRRAPQIGPSWCNKVPPITQVWRPHLTNPWGRGEKRKGRGVQVRQEVEQRRNGRKGYANEKKACVKKNKDKEERRRGEKYMKKRKKGM
ncbi:hypothetical protein E2C01_088908 [Portunus trituberculatus]|uniref:Uncharacterized protein n=1 Tax=Portunus trituberculatus TaxID=210409 RepID=A0A5B7JKV2_PORTR|nr:hypothetical protein [Portunus trituberculatus]